MKARTSAAARLTLSLAAMLAVMFAPARHAAAFCGFYVTGADANLYSNATMVVLMRDGTRTVLSIQNNYQGPPEAFALVVPVPMVLQKENVKVLEKDVFQRVDALGAPRLVEYWEVDPCQPRFEGGLNSAVPPTAPSASTGAAAADAVKVEAQFAVGEYDVVVLSADDSSALDTWLRANKYNIPDGAAPVLQPYVAANMKFFVAKVDPTRVTFNGNQAVLSPLRFYYDTPDFSLPVRLGLLNSQGTQDLIVNILAKQRYEVANYPNVTIPTNIRVQNDVRNAYASFYEALYARTLEQNAKAVVTEYSWASGSCDPCPTPPLTQQDLLTLGADVLETADARQPAAGSGGAAPVIPPTGSSLIYNMTLTRLHARYTKDTLGEDLVFQAAPAIVGGRGIPDNKGNLDQTVMNTGGDYNNFQGRYVILHAWDKDIACQTPVRGQWGGPTGMFSAPQSQAPVNNALLGMAPKAGDLSALVAESIPALSVMAKTPIDPLAPATAKAANPTAPASGAAGAKSTTSTGGSSSTPATTSTTSITSTSPTTPTTPATSTTANTAPTTKHSSGCTVAHGRSSSGFALASLIASVMLFGRRRSRTL
jgi:hypothetical protein